MDSFKNCFFLHLIEVCTFFLSKYNKISQVEGVYYKLNIKIIFLFRKLQI